MARTVSEEQVAALRTTLARLTGQPGLELAASELAAAVRAVCGLLAARHPGGVVELRVPPYAAVQLGLGDRGRHTRGTPPNVAETDPATLLALAAGSLAWTDAVAAGRVRASGIRSDLSGLWPLPELTGGPAGR